MTASHDISWYLCFLFFDPWFGKEIWFQIRFSHVPHLMKDRLNVWRPAIRWIAPMNWVGRTSTCPTGALWHWAKSFDVIWVIWGHCWWRKSWKSADSIHFFGFYILICRYSELSNSARLGLVQAIHRKTSIQRLCLIKSGPWCLPGPTCTDFDLHSKLIESLRPKHELPPNTGPKEAVWDFADSNNALAWPGMMYVSWLKHILSNLLHFADSRWPWVDTDKVSQLVDPTLVSYVSFQHLSILEEVRSLVRNLTKCDHANVLYLHEALVSDFLGRIQRQSCVMYLMVRRWRTSHTFTSCTSNISVSCPYVHRPCPFGLEGGSRQLVQTVWQSIEPPDWCRLLTGCSL